MVHGRGFMLFHSRAHELAPAGTCVRRPKAFVPQNPENKNRFI